MRRYFILFIFALSLFGCSSEKTDKKASAYKPVEAGSPAVDFLFSDMDGKKFRLSEEKGKVVLLFFWRMACDDCKESMKSLEELHLKHKGNGLAVVTVDADTMHSSPITEVREYLNQKKYTFRVLRDSDGFVAEAYQVMRAPAAYYIDREGVLKAIKYGKTDFMDAGNLAFVEGLLKK